MSRHAWPIGIVLVGLAGLVGLALVVIPGAELRAQQPQAPNKAAPTADPLGARIGALVTKHRRHVVTVSYSRQVQAGPMGQQDAGGTVVGTLVSEDGLVMLSGQQFLGGNLLEQLGALSGQGRGRAPITDWRVRLSSGVEFPARYLGGDREQNLTFVALKLDGMTVRAVDFAATATPKLAERVLVLSAHGKNLGFARKFHVARVNSIVDLKKGLFGLDGNFAADLGALVVGLDGRLLGVVGAKPDASQNPMASGLGGLMRRFTQPAQASVTGLLFTHNWFASAIERAKKRAATPPEEPTPPVTPGETPGETPARPPTPADPGASAGDAAGEAATKALGIARYTPVSPMVVTLLKAQGRDVTGLLGGVLVLAVTADSPAAKAGLATRDIVTAVTTAPDKKTDLSGVRGADDLARFRQALAGSAATLTLTVWRAGKTLTLTLTR